jgi:CheY-like chemotaxis protein
MPITKSIVELMNGEIKVDSKKDVGTTFTVTVTLTDSEQQIEELGTEDTEDRVSLTGRRILLAEDMEINAEIMKEILSTEDMKVDHAENGEEALEMFSASEEHFFDAILMDMRMPKMDGLEATKAIRSLDRGDSKTIPIIALTANAFNEDVERSLQAGLDAHLSKPVDPEALFDTLSRLIKS